MVATRNSNRMAFAIYIEKLYQLFEYKTSAVQLFKVYRIISLKVSAETHKLNQQFNF